MQAWRRHRGAAEIGVGLQAEVVLGHGVVVVAVATAVALGRNSRGVVLAYRWKQHFHSFTLIMVYKGCMDFETRGIPYFSQSFDSFYPLFFFKKYSHPLFFDDFFSDPLVLTQF